jgi:hypothetical protein
LPFPPALQALEEEDLQDACRDLLNVLDDVRMLLPKSVADYAESLARAARPKKGLVDSWCAVLEDLRAHPFDR